MPEGEVLGVDGDKAGWVGVLLVGGRFTAARLAGTLAELARHTGAPDVVAIDMPIGWCETTRACDKELRRRLPGKASSVFNAPPAAVRATSSYADANTASREATGTGISRQSWALLDRIDEATTFRLESGLNVIEAHPEWSFALMADGRPAAAPKSSWAGHRERVGRLASVGIHLPDDLGDAGAAGIADVLDAAAAAWTACRWVAGRSVELTEPSANVAAGGPVGIWG